MPKINVYLPDDLAVAVKEANVPVSAICQAALERVVREVTALREGGPEGRSAGDQDWAAGTGVAFARYTNRARQAVALGRQAATTLGHSYVGTEHLLLGVLDEGGNLAVRVLEALDVAPEDVRAELGAYVRAGEGSEPATSLTPHLRRALELATGESVRLGHNYVGCEHLLLGLVAEPDGLAGSVLRQLGLELRVTRRAVVTALSGYMQARANEPVIATNRFDEILRRLDAIETRLATGPAA